ncbi:CgeB family protein [Deminuibacter soli]|uniref:Glycosyltransferase family 1 protein n=1 Tax=Deminuibacter soli TaxID=2291815 RepID=A0A3E1NHH5_9BACT|nr:glycosyltransferase [Deminuibacter soli]RFM27399.1 glycosyltransferase family 1 protein [Deminuibacter soli]
MQAYKNSKILYVGNLSKTGNCYRRMLQLEKLVDTVDAIDIVPHIYASGLFTRLHYHLQIGPGIRSLNKAFKKKVSEQKYDIIWIDNRSYITASSLAYAKKTHPGTVLMSLLIDDPFGEFTRGWKIFLQSCRRLDWVFVQRPQNVQELKNIGAVNVDFCFRSFDPQWARPYAFSSKEERNKYRHEVGFIGTYEEQRAEYIAYLIEKGIKVKVIGSDWLGKNHWATIAPCYAGAAVYGDEYAKSLSGLSIALHFLRQGNRDQQDSRTFEIPACKTFMLAQRTPLHEQFFEEGKEAVFFDTKEELLNKIDYYLQHPAEREDIAEAGYKRSYASGYDHLSRLENILKKITAVTEEHLVTQDINKI